MAALLTGRRHTHPVLGAERGWRIARRFVQTGRTAGANPATGANRQEARTMTTPRRKPEPDDCRCTACNGTKQAVPDCEECEGNGWVPDPDDGGTMTCPEC